MKNIKKIWKVLPILGMVLTIVLLNTGNNISFAQTSNTNYPSLTCSPSSSSVGINSDVTLSASGGTGSYTWSGSGLDSTSTTANSNTVSYSTPGSYTATVISGNQSANCFITVVDNSSNSNNSNSNSSSSSGSLQCTPSSQTANVGQQITVTATGGTGVYTWASPDINLANNVGTGFVATYGTSGTKTLSVSSGGDTVTCVINVIGGVANVPTTTPTPSLPNTGGGYGK